MSFATFINDNTKPKFHHLQLKIIYKQIIFSCINFEKDIIKVFINQSFNNQQIKIENKFYLFGYKRCKRQLHGTRRA